MTTFGFTEWINHCTPSEHCEKVKTIDLQSSTIKLTSYFSSTSIKWRKPSTLIYHHYKQSKTVMTCPWFGHGKNCKFLQLYDKYKKKDHLSESTFIGCKDCFWSICLNECTNEVITVRISKCMDTNACEKCFNFPSIQKIKDRIKRMHNIFHIK